MKKIILTLLVILSVFIAVNAQNAGNLSVTVTSSAAGGNYAPKHVMAIWVEDASGKFVKTLLSYANTRKGYLTNWKNSTNKAGSQYNTVDAITSATQTSHSTRKCSWSGTDYSKNEVPDGKYQLCMELTDKNSTGNFSKFEIEKSGTSLTFKPANVPSFSNLNIIWTPTGNTSVFEVSNNDGITLFPNPTTGMFEVQGNSIIGIAVMNSNGQLLKLSSQQGIDLSNQPKGVYVVKITTDKKIVSRKLLKD